MIKYTNTRGSTVRLQTSQGVVILRGEESVELNEEVHHPYFVTKTEVVKVAKKPAAKKPAVKKAEPKKSSDVKKTEE